MNRRTKDARMAAVQRLLPRFRTDHGDSPEAQRDVPEPARPNAASRRPPADKRLRRGYWRTARAVLGDDRLPEGWQDLGFDAPLDEELRERASLHSALATYADLIARGADVDSAQVATIKALIDAGERRVARSFSVGLAEGGDGGDRIKRLGLALCLHDLRRYAFAWEQLRDLEPAFLARHAAVEALDCALTADTPESEAQARAIAEHHAIMDPSWLPALAGRYLVTGHRDLAIRLVEAAAGQDLDDFAEEHLAVLRRWTHPEAAERPARHQVTIGVIDYYSPDLAKMSRNVGDYVQTLAMLGHLARFQGVTYHGDDGLGELMGDLQSRLRPELRLQGPAVDVDLVPVSRDYSEGDVLPDDTWMLAFGWHMHGLFRLRFGMPYHRSINPVFISFHINRPTLLTPEAVAYLREHGPIGCRDWTTVDLLLSAGVDAFFSGCLTTTVNAVFPDRDQLAEESQVVALIDAPTKAVKRAGRRAEVFTHGDMEYRRLNLTDGVHAADELMQTYLRRFQRIVTSRLHSYLPATSLGVPVKFEPRIPGDVRFEGLHGLKPGEPRFEHMRDDIRALVASTFEKVLAGAPRDDVYAHWRELTADKVAEARRRFEAPPAPFTVPLDVYDRVARVRSRMHRYGPHDQVVPDQVTNVAVSSDENFAHLLPVTVESLVANAEGPLRIFVTGRGLDERYRSWLSGAFPAVPFTFLEYDDVDYGAVGRMIEHITVATMDRLLLPEVLPDVDRIVYVDVDTVTLGDVCRLSRLDLGGHPLAARTTMFQGWAIWRGAGNLITPDRAAELRRTMSARHPYDFSAFNAGVLVLDLDRMRRDGFVERFVPMAAEFGLNDQDVLLAYVGGDRAELDRRWNALPVNESVHDAWIVHYAGAGKPWDDGLVPYHEHWRTYAERFAARMGGE